MKTTRYILALIASALLFVLSGCQSASSSNDPIFEPVPPQKTVVTGDYCNLADTDTRPDPAGARATPVYPFKLKLKNVSGEAIIAFVVTTDGRTDQVQVVRATHRGFADAAVEAIKKWRFKPAIKDGKPVNCLITVPMSFNSNG